jgi:hypothetical protein
LLFTALGLLHRLTSIHAVLASPILRDEIRTDPRRYLWVPAVILGTTLLLAQAFVFHPAFAFLGSAHGQMWAFFVLAYVMILWERWHFCMQEFGVLSLYRGRARQFALADRRFDRAYVVLLMLVVNMVLYVCQGFGDERQVLLGGTRLSTLQGPIFEPLAGAAFAVGMLGLVVAVGREWRHRQRSIPKLLFYVLVGLHTLVLYCLPQALGLFFLSYVFHHWMVAVGLFNRIMLNSQPEATALGRAGALLRNVGPVFALCLVVQLFFEPLNKAANLSPVPDTLWFSGASPLARCFSGVAIGGFFAFNFLHYYYDRCLYSFTRPGVRKAVMPLLFEPTRT